MNRQRFSLGLYIIYSELAYVVEVVDRDMPKVVNQGIRALGRPPICNMHAPT